MIKIDDVANTDLDAVAVLHYDRLIGPLLRDGINYHATNSLIQRIRLRRNEDIAIPDPTRVAFWDYLLNNNFRNLQRLIVSRPDEFNVIINEITVLCGANFFSNHIDYNRANLTQFGLIVKEIFNYEGYRKKQVCIDNFNRLNLSYCPYCNEQTIQAITNINLLTGEAKDLALLQLDHFYPQARHPYLSVSFFNLIPGCSNCNAALKKEKLFNTTTHLNPFEKRFDDYFQFSLNSVLLNSEQDVVISFQNKLAFPTNAMTDFSIINRYENVAHRRAVYKMVSSFSNYSPKVRRSIGQQLIGLFTTESKRRVLLQNYNVPVQRDDINYVQLGKLKRDIAIQLDLLTV